MQDLGRYWRFFHFYMIFGSKLGPNWPFLTLWPRNALPTHLKTIYQKPHSKISFRFYIRVHLVHLYPTYVHHFKDFSSRCMLQLKRRVAHRNFIYFRKKLYILWSYDIWTRLGRSSLESEDIGIYSPPLI